MPDDFKSHSSECSPRRLAKKIESCIYRNALDEEQRAQKALYLLQARDRRIALLEKRVAELEDAATNLHELTLRNSSRGSTLDSTSEKVRSYNEASCKSECDFEDVNSTGRGGNVARGPREDREPAANGRVSVPCLDLSKSSESASDIFSTAIDFVMEKSKCFPSNTSFSVEEEATEREEFNEGENLGNSKSEVKIAGSSSNVGSSRKEDSGGVGGNRSEFENKNKDCVGMGGRSEEKVRGNKYQRSNFPRLTSSVPWIRAKHSFRKKLRGYELKTGKRIKDVSYGDGHLAFAAFHLILDRRIRSRKIGDGSALLLLSRSPLLLSFLHFNSPDRRTNENDARGERVESRVFKVR